MIRSTLKPIHVTPVSILSLGISLSLFETRTLTLGSNSGNFVGHPYCSTFNEGTIFRRGLFLLAGSEVSTELFLRQYDLLANRFSFSLLPKDLYFFSKRLNHVFCLS